MRNTYTVTLKVANREVLADIIDAVEGKAASIEIATASPVQAIIKAAATAQRRSPLDRKPRTMRVSKVNQAILDAMSDRPASVSEMKAALERAGMSSGSFSTGIAALTKTGQIERLGDGRYGLKTVKAAE